MTEGIRGPSWRAELRRYFPSQSLGPDAWHQPNLGLLPYSSGQGDWCQINWGPMEKEGEDGSRN